MEKWKDIDLYMFDLRKPGSEKRTAGLVIFCALILLTSGTMLNVWFGRSARQVLRDRFNSEQLVVARSVRHWLETRMDTLQKELLLAADSLKEGDGSREDLARILQPCFDRVMEMGVRKIELRRGDGRQVLACYPSPLRIVVESGEAPAAGAPGVTATGDAVAVSDPVVDGTDIYLTLSVTPDHPEFETLSFQLNAAWFLGPFLKSIRSGATGYAWIIDSRGRFLYHPQATFIGRSAFEARQDRDPDISYHQIYTIQRDRMLKGMEGTGVYTSAWHRGITGEIEKLIAYTPVTVSTAPKQVWSVAVVAPLFEIEEGLKKIHRWQALLQGLMVLVILTAGGIVLWFEIRWSRRLKKMVAARTQALARSEEKYRSLVESAEDFIFTVDGEGVLVSVNSFTAAFFGCRPEEVLGQGIDRLFSPEVARRQKEIIRTVYDRGKSMRHEFELTNEGSDEIWLSANFMPMKDEAGEMSAVLCIARDITDHKKLERFLVTTEKLASLGTLAAGVAHEINNPLGVMLGFCDLLVRKKTPGSQEYEDLKVIERQGMHCKQIVENLLSFSRVGRRKSCDVDLNECLKQIVTVVRHSLEMNAIDLQLDLTDALPRAVGDDRQLQQVFLNLINNAAAAMPRGGPITIRACPRSAPGKVCVLVEDRGAGIAPEHLDHIFEPFYTTKPEGEGTGLGLFVSYGIIHKFGGSITCESRTQGTRETPRGTTFKVTLPIYREATCREEF